MYTRAKECCFAVLAVVWRSTAARRYTASGAFVKSVGRSLKLKRVRLLRVRSSPSNLLPIFHVGNLICWAKWPRSASGGQSVRGFRISHLRIWRMAFPIKRLLAFMPGGLFVALSQIEIEHETENRLVLSADGWPIIFDRSSRVVSHSGQIVAAFSSFETVDITHFVNGKRFEWWVLSLTLRGGKKLALGRSTDGIQVSMVAAHTATITGKRVCTAERVGL
jgi:hypothetical protein